MAGPQEQAEAEAQAVLGEDVALPNEWDATAFSHVPEHGFSLFLARRTKLIHFIRHAEGIHNAANSAYGDDTPVTFSTPGSEAYMDSHLTDAGITQCQEGRYGILLKGLNPEVIVVSPFTRTLQTAHILFASKGIPFIVHDACRERSGRYMCDKRRSKTEILGHMRPVYAATNEIVDFESFAFGEEDDVHWTEEREADESVNQRAVEMLNWLATRPENEIAVVTHSSWLRHLFRSFGKSLAGKDKQHLHRKHGNAEVRSITLALHRGFYPEGEWHGDIFTPHHPSFRKGKWAAAAEDLLSVHAGLREAQAAKFKA